MPKCDVCGTSTKALHTGGDAGIPGDGKESGVCSECEVILATAAREARSAARAEKIAARVAEITGKAPPAPKGPKGGSS